MMNTSCCASPRKERTPIRLLGAGNFWMAPTRFGSGRRPSLLMVYPEKGGIVPMEIMWLNLSLRADVIHEELRIARSRAGSVQVQACSPSPPMSEDSGPAASSQMNQVNAMSRSPSSKLCNLHRKFGFNAFHCRGGDCPLRNEPLAVSPKTPSSQTKTRSGNERSGR